jgi:nitrogen fixation NifU-like protein
MEEELYQELILDYAKRPRNFGPLAGCTHLAEGHNALCGDEICVSLRLEEGRVAEAKFTGSACAICTASAGVMTGAVKGKTPEEARLLAGTFRQLARGEEPENLPERVRLLAGVSRFPQRVKCAVLPWETLARAVETPAPPSPRRPWARISAPPRQ